MTQPTDSTTVSAIIPTPSPEGASPAGAVNTGILTLNVNLTVPLPTAQVAPVQAPATVAATPEKAKPVNKAPKKPNPPKQECPSLPTFSPDFSVLGQNFEPLTVLPAAIATPAPAPAPAKVTSHIDAEHYVDYRITDDKGGVVIIDRSQEGTDVTYLDPKQRLETNTREPGFELYLIPEDGGAKTHYLYARDGTWVISPTAYDGRKDLSKIITDNQLNELGRSGVLGYMEQHPAIAEALLKHDGIKLVQLHGEEANLTQIGHAVPQFRIAGPQDAGVIVGTR